MATPYRADQVGSFLRPPEVKEAHTAHRAGRLSAADLRQLEDAAILRVLELQQEIGVDVFSDGEFRRGGWSGDFVESVEGYGPGEPAVTVFNTAAGNAPGQRPAAQARVITEKLRQKRRLTEHESGFLQQHAPGPFKMTMPAASYVLARGYQPRITDQVYGTRAAALHDVASIIKTKWRRWSTKACRTFSSIIRTTRTICPKSAMPSGGRLAWIQRGRSKKTSRPTISP